MGDYLTLARPKINQTQRNMRKGRILNSEKFKTAIFVKMGETYIDQAFFG